MNRYLFLLPSLMALGLLALRPAKTDLDGNWRGTAPSGAAVVLTVADNYLMQTRFTPGQFMGSRGGVATTANGNLSLTVEFDSLDSSRVGQTETYTAAISGTQLTLNGPSGAQVFTRVGDAPTPLSGLWRITGRAGENGQLTTMQRGPRKTIKLLTGSRFQWAAINPDTKQFMGTGGGTYRFADNQYTETIDFFSRDNSRVGRSLTFAARLTGTDWHHTGSSSAGKPVSEVWSRDR